MRVFLLLLVTCLVLLVLVEGKSSKDSKSKDHSSKHLSHGKVAKVKAKHSRHSSSDSSESSEHRHNKKHKHHEEHRRHEEHKHHEEHRHKHKKKNMEKFKSEESFDSRKANATKNHKISLNHNSTRIIGDGFNNNTGKLFPLTKNVTTHESLKFNNMQSSGHKENKTLHGLIFVKPNISRTNSANQTNNNVLNNFLQSEKGVKVINGSQLHSNNNKWNNSGIPPPIGLMNFNATGLEQGLKNFNANAPAEGWKNFNATGLSQGWKNFNATGPSQGWKNFNANAPAEGWKNLNATSPGIGWKNFNATGSEVGWKNFNAPTQGWKTNPNPVQGWNIEPSAPDYRKEFSVPDHTKDQRYYFDSPGMGGYLQRNPNFINNDNRPIAYPLDSDYNKKSISNIAPEYSWGPQPSYNYNDQYNADGKIFNNYPKHKSYDSSEENSSEIAKGVKKMFKKIGKGAGKVLSSDPVKDAMKQTASSYFANPPPNGFIYNPPYSNKRQTFYSGLPKPVGKESMSTDDWRSIIFGNVPRKVETRNLYSAAFPETYQNLDLHALSEKGRLPDFNRTQYKLFFPNPHYQKLFAGLQNEDINERFRTKRELSEEGKAMAKVINKFFLHERDCNDTELDARKKRDLVIRPLKTNAGAGGFQEENRITNFPFSGVEAIVQSDFGISVYEEVPKQLQLDNNATEKTVIDKVTEENISTTEPPSSISRNRTKLYPVSETIEQFLNKKPATRLRVIDESLEKWKSKARTENNTYITPSSESYNQEVNSTNFKRIVRSRDTSSERNFTPFYRLFTDRYSDSEINTLYITPHYKDNMEGSESKIEPLHKEMKSNTPSMFLQDSNEHFSTPENYNPQENSQEEETSSSRSFESAESTRKNGFYFFGVYINDYNDQKRENHASNKDSEESLSQDTERSTPVSDLSTDDSDLETAFVQSTIPAISALSYSNHEELSTENVKIIPQPAISEPVLNTGVPDKYATSKPSNLFYLVPFKINTISSINYTKDPKKGSKSTRKDDTENITAKTSIIKAPLITNRCDRNSRMMKGRCRKVW
ncbi:unnamed protein product [Nezara viridula]|uniref:Neuropeptide n=1 Tax=Nezara viridula TaxID=85310 RepID=A0A9P0H9K1_NEZVI|nr:unnamed protein product [Nezara viridula]